MSYHWKRATDLQVRDRIHVDAELRNHLPHTDFRITSIKHGDETIEIQAQDITVFERCIALLHRKPDDEMSVWDGTEAQEEENHGN